MKKALDILIQLTVLASLCYLLWFGVTSFAASSITLAEVLWACLLVPLAITGGLVGSALLFAGAVIGVVTLLDRL